MTTRKVGGRDRERPENITPVILWCERQGMREKETLSWIEENAPDILIHAQLYFAYKNAGRGNPLQRPISQINLSVLKNA